VGTKQLVISTCNIASLARNISSLFHLSLQSCDCAESLSFPSFSVEQKHGRPLDNCRETSTHLISGVCVAYYEFPGGPYFKWRGLQTTDQPPLTLTYIILTTHLKFSIQHWSGSYLSSSTKSTGMEVARGIATSTGQATVMIMTNINDTTKRHILAWVRVVWAVESVERSDVQTSFQIQRGLSKFCYNSPICQQPAWTDFH